MNRTLLKKFPISALAKAAAALTALGLHGTVFAQTSPTPSSTSSASTAASTTASMLEKVIVTGNPLGSRDIASPISVLTGDALMLKRASTLGETLDGLPGVSSTSFGPNAARPVIRGLDGDRVRILSNAGASLDASSLSYDHAVPIDPLIIERLEVLRGPGALLYGGSAVGGVVNALDNRIPKERLNGMSGAAEVRFGGAERERGGAALIEFGKGDSQSAFAGHVDVFGRSTADLAVPRYVPIEDGNALPSATRVRNSASSTRGGALGASVFFGHSRIGASLDTYDSTYGTVVESDVVIKMKRNHLGLSAEFKELVGPFSALRVQLNNTRYQHQEVNGQGEIGTTFKTSGTELRAEAEHVKWAVLGGREVRGVLGVQLEDFLFSALGDEAFVPSTRTQKQGIFALEELTWAGGVLSAGLRLERAQVNSQGDADPAQPKFGDAVRRKFSLRSASLANVAKLNAQWTLVSTISHSQRAPTSFELYANGVHAATGTIERGDVSLNAEPSNNLDVALRWKSGSDHLSLGVFTARFSNFISLEDSGQVVQEPDGQGGFNSYPEYFFKPVRARLNGIEIEGQKRLYMQAASAGNNAFTLDLTGKLDVTRAVNVTTSEPLPRVAPLRISLGLDARSGPWAARAELNHASRQDRVPSTDVATGGYAIVNFSLTRRFTLLGESDSVWFLKLNNAGNTLAYSAGAIPSVRDLSPLAGRALKAGMRVSF